MWARKIDPDDSQLIFHSCLNKPTPHGYVFRNTSSQELTLLLEGDGWIRAVLISIRNEETLVTFPSCIMSHHRNIPRAMGLRAGGESSTHGSVLVSTGFKEIFKK